MLQNFRQFFEHSIQVFLQSLQARLFAANKNYLVSGLRVFFIGIYLYVWTVRITGSLNS